MPRLLGITYSFCKALPKINEDSLIDRMETDRHIGQKLQEQAERLGLKPAQVADLFGVKPPSVYDWYAHGRIHKRHYPVLVGKFGRPLEWWLDFAPGASTSPVSAPSELSATALELARLFDLIPAKDTVKRAQAQMACAQAIINLLQTEPSERVHTAPDNKTQNS